VGEIVSPGPRAASVADLSQWLVETDDLSEVDIVNVQPGASATITVDALPGTTLNGTVKSIVPRSIVKRGDVTFTVRVTITNPDSRLKWGMTAFTDITGK
jgi:multidrug resistance efflux pump